MSLSQIFKLMTTTPRRRPDLGALVRDVAVGDRDALAELYRQVEGSVFAFARSRLGDGEAAADVLQEVMLTVWRRAGTFRGSSRPLTWILGITHHKIVDDLRRRGRWQDEPPDQETVDMAPTPFDATEHSERRAAVQTAMATLSDAHRQVVHLAFFEDLAYSEIARVLDIPEGTVKTRMLHAKKHLARRLTPHLAGAAS